MLSSVGVAAVGIVGFELRLRGTHVAAGDATTLRRRQGPMVRNDLSGMA